MAENSNIQSSWGLNWLFGFLLTLFLGDLGFELKLGGS